MEPFLGQIQIFGFNFAPRGWAQCDGQLLSIAQNSALFSLLGTTYGGDGQTTFALPDLRGRVPIHMGTGAGLSARQIGQRSGAENVALNIAHLPGHNHELLVSNEPGTTDEPGGGYAAITSEDAYGAGSLVSAGDAAITSAGGGQAHTNMQPYLVMNYCIATQGIFPSRN